MKSEKKQLHYPAPRTDYVRTQFGWVSIPWNKRSKKLAELDGAWFKQPIGAHHDYNEGK